MITDQRIAQISKVNSLKAQGHVDSAVQHVSELLVELERLQRALAAYERLTDTLRSDRDKAQRKYQDATTEYKNFVLQQQAKLAAAKAERKSVIDAAIEFVGGGTMGKFIAGIDAAKNGGAGVSEDKQIETHPVQSNYPPTHLPKVVTLRAYEVYCRVFSPQQALVEGECRGGFSLMEVIAFLYARSFPEKEWDARFHEALKGFTKRRHA